MLQVGWGRTGKSFRGEKDGGGGAVNAHNGHRNRQGSIIEMTKKMQHQASC